MIVLIIDDALLYAICADKMPLKTTEKRGMKFLLKTCAPLYEPPGHHAITNRLEIKYKDSS